MSLLDTLIMAESNGRNIPNVTDSGPGPGGGYFQIKDNTWSIYARRAGIDLAKFPDAMSAPYAIQKQVADVIPIGQWGPRTKRLVRAAGYNIDEKKTLAENIAAVGETGIVPKLSDAGRQLSPQTANLGPAPKGTAYGEDKSAGTPSAGTPMSGGDGKPGNDLASAFADALGGMSIGGTGGASGGISGDSSLPGSGDLRTAVGNDPSLGQDWAALQAGSPPGQLADLFALPAIGEAAKIKPVNIAAKSWI
jgi:hypothetical protein